MKIGFFCTCMLGLLALPIGIRAMPVINTPVPSRFDTTPSARFLNMETPFRCSVNNFGDQEISTTIALKPSDFRLTFFDETDKLPRFEVNGFSFDAMSVDEALQKLLDEADITVYTEDGAYPELDAKDVYGELSAVIGELTRAGDTFYKYDAERKELYLARKGRFELQLPDNRMVMLAMLDALRGAGLKEMTPDWKKNTILLTLTQNDKATVESLIDYIVNDSYLLLADTQVYRLTPKTSEANWQKTVDTFGAGKIYSATNGLMGKALITGHHTKTQGLLSTLGHDFTVTPISQGVAIVPNGWKMRFDVGRCAFPHESSSLSVLLNARIRSTDTVETDVTLDTRAGEVSTFNTIGALDNELVILGIPSLNPTTPDGSELLVTLKLRLIRLIKEQ